MHHHPYVMNCVSQLSIDAVRNICFTATKHQDIFHSMDVWHKAKKLKKALAMVSFVRFCIIL